MRKGRMVVALCMAAAPAAASAEQAPEVLTRSDKWVLDQGQDSCQLAAQFGEKDAMVIAKFSRFQPGESFNLALLGNRMHSSSPRGQAKIDFGLGTKPLETTPINGKLGKWDASFFRGLRLDDRRRDKPDDPDPAITPQQEAAVKGVTIAIQGKRPFRLAFGSLAKPFAMLRECATGLVSGWGYDAEVQARLLRRVKPPTSAGGWLTPEDYPMDALRQGYGGFVQVRLDVDAAGGVAGCHVVERTDQEAFSKTVCAAIQKRAKLDPALDERGQPVRSYILLKYQFEITT